MKSRVLFIIYLGIFSCFAMGQDTLFIHGKTGYKYGLKLVPGDKGYTYGNLIYEAGITGYKYQYLLPTIDSLTFSKNSQGVYDTLNMHPQSYFYKSFWDSTGLPLRDTLGKPIYSTKRSKSGQILIASIDSITFKKADTLDYSTPANFDLVLNAAYAYAKAWYGKEEGIGVSEMGTDLWTAGASGDPSIIFYNSLSPISFNFAHLWKQLYSGVNMCNTGIKIIKDKNIASTDIRFQKSAELRFLRAFYNWHIVETWGGVHLTTEPYFTIPILKMDQTPKAMFLPTATRASEMEFYNLIIEDLKFAVQNLPLNSPELGRVNATIAKALLARVYLTKGYKDATYFPLAKQLAAEVIASGNYSLADKYSDLWDMDKQTAPANKEVIWSIVYSPDLSKSDVYNATTNPFGYPNINRGNNNYHLFFIPPYDQAIATALIRDIPNGRPFNRFMPTKFLLNLFDETKDARYEGSFQSVWYANQNPTVGDYSKPLVSDPTKKAISIGDTALFVSKYTFLAPKITIQSNLSTTKSIDKYIVKDVNAMYHADGTSNGNSFYPALKKHKDPTRNNAAQAQSERDVFVLRLAEMYFIAAEAELAIGNTQAAADLINVIRNRAAIVKGTMNVTAADMTLDFILDEKAREFAGELNRWFDLKRTNKLTERVQKYNPNASGFIQNFHTIRPIPKEQLDLLPSNSTFNQNTGY